ncbi:MAG: 4Fe-4S binding protein, partial [Lachnospiraceae bacterium]|nr:4Fe-4S binding protein [Lachnospiraceae bacterium]
LLKGKQVKDACSIGCIACGICEKNCPFDANHVLNDLAVMDEKCKDCGICAQKCPTSAITGKRVKKAEPAKEAAANPVKQEEQAAVPVASEHAAEAPVQA